ncbi:MAG TPA: hypothetical protein VL122_02000 [Nitrospirota bacterium]|nr:hypothetical protein [Nitrospirota bacterium]
MKKCILVGFGLVLFVSWGGSIAAILYVAKTTDYMDNLVTLHRAVILSF